MHVPADAIIVDQCTQQDHGYAPTNAQDFFQLEPGSVLLDESEVTGYKAFVLKGVQSRKTSQQEVE